MSATSIPAPTDLPKGLAEPNAAYRQQTVLALASLFAFIVFYFLLAAWFSWSAFRFLSTAYPQGLGGLIYWVLGFSALFLSVFMVKALFFIRKGGAPNDLEITPAQEPKLFEFIYALADNIGAPRPHRVFLSGRVNACVFYDLSIKNLLFPSKKNLEIGLPLVNALTASEVKAVLAHEFGHFSQRTMAIGSWVYIAQQIAAHIIAQRDALDEFLRSFSRWNVRVAWIAWVLRLIVWSLRSLLETAFEWVVIAQRALSREMEFQADLVAVAQSGSDAIVHALYRLPAADDAWTKALGFASKLASSERYVSDVFAAQRHVQKCLARIHNDPDYGALPKQAATPDASTRLFSEELAQPPRMWSTHPPSHEREGNAKKIYVPCELSDSSAWILFDDPEAMRQEFTRHLLPRKDDEQGEVLSESAITELLDKRYNREYLRSEYQSIYLGRSCARHAESASDLFDVSVKAEPAALQSLYPQSIAHDMHRLRQVEREKALIQALHDGQYEAPGGVIRYRGEELQAHELPATINALGTECRALEQALIEHDRQCRSLHLDLARAQGMPWEAYYQGLVSVLHYAEHSAANVTDAQGALGNVYGIVTADGRLSGRERKRLVNAAADLYAQLAIVYDHAQELHIPAPLLKELGITDWTEALGNWGLPQPNRDNLGEWLGVVDGWVAQTVGLLDALRAETLEHLLSCERALREALSAGTKIEVPDQKIRVPADYPVLLLGAERARQKKLGLWDRFQTADGPIASACRLLVSLGIVGGALSLTILIR